MYKLKSLAIVALEPVINGQWVEKYAFPVIFSGTSEDFVLSLLTDRKKKHAKNSDLRSVTC